MKTRNLVAFILMVVFITGCDNCGDELVKYTVALASVPILQKRISGYNYINFAKEDPSDNYYEHNGVLCVAHHTGCNSWIFSTGNSGPDIFFDNNHSLPSGCSVIGVDFKQMWPNGICASGEGDVFGGGTYGATISGAGSYPVKVNWNNSCKDDFGNKTLYYSISFRISMPQGMDIRDSVYDISTPFVPCSINGYQDWHPTNCEPTPIPCTVSKTTDFPLNLIFSQVWEGVVNYSAIMNAPYCGGKLIKITNPNFYAIVIRTPSHSLTLAELAATTASDINTLYGSSIPSLPVAVNAHPVIHIDPGSRSSIPVVVTYSYLE